MPVDASFAQLTAQIGAFHITDAAMRRAQERAEAAIARGDVNETEMRAYLGAARRYFSSFDREARAHLRDVDRRLTRANQIVFNLTAERGVAVKRIEATGAVLAALADAETPAQ
jgi:hypothetical protein